MIEKVENIKTKPIFSYATAYLGSEMSRSLGSLKAAWIWLVNAPGVKRPAMEEQPMYLQICTDLGNILYFTFFNVQRVSFNLTLPISYN